MAVQAAQRPLHLPAQAELPITSRYDRDPDPEIDDPDTETRDPHPDTPLIPFPKRLIPMPK
jgi:hypothetical protein